MPDWFHGGTASDAVESESAFLQIRYFSMMSRILKLEPTVVNRIAAGEVIERPASVVKELLENGIDALASRIKVEIRKGGKESIRVSDNGRGIHPDDLELAVTSHATSKISTSEELFRVHTLGFRGEALASIAAVGRFRIQSRQKDSLAGSEISVDCGRMEQPKPCGCPPGTMVEIEQLFMATPVRRKFLKADGTEFAHIAEQFLKLALAHPRIHFELIHNGKIVHDFPPVENLTDRVAAIHGREFVEEMIPIEAQSGELRIWGYVADPSHSKANRKGQYLFLNGRWIQDRSLQHALGEAYRGLLMVGRYPVTFLFLEVPAAMVDCNVHPTKIEVRFRDPQQVYRLVLSTLRKAFLASDLHAQLQLGGTQTPAGLQPTVNPAAQAELQRELVDWANNELTISIANDNARGFTPPSFAVASAGAEADPEDHSFRFDSANDSSSQMSHDGRSPTSAPPTDLALKVMQVHDCYLVVETENGLTVIDQHALHERVMFQQMRKKMESGRLESQKLLIPETVDFSPEEKAKLLENTELLKQLGFEISDFGGATVAITSHPSLLRKTDLAEIIRDLAETFFEGGQKPAQHDILEELLQMMSCKAAVKAGQRLSIEEMESLLAQRNLVDHSHHCPHGRPTALHLSRMELDRKFGRLG